MEGLARMPSNPHINQQALGIVLQRLESLPIALNLMSASKQLRATVLGHCVGALDVTQPASLRHCVRQSSEDRTRQFASWLRKYGFLAGSLGMHYTGIWGSWEELEAELVAALQEAAAAPEGLHMHSFSLEAITTPTAAKLLRLLPPAKVTTLDLSLADRRHDDDDLFTQINHSLGRLTNLRSLDLVADAYNGDWHSTCAYVTGLSTLTQLTSVKLDHIGNGEVLQHLPMSLLELAVTRDFGTADKDCWLLGHLTKLTKLVSDTSVQVSLNEGDILPPNLLILEAWYIQHAQPLLPLHKLQRLYISEVQMPAEEMQQLSSLTAVTDVHFEHLGVDSITEAAAGWSALRGLHTLRLSNTPGEPNVVLPAVVADGLSKLSWLTELDLEHISIPHQFVAEDLAHGLSGLVGLKTLSLNTSNWGRQQQELDPEQDWIQSQVAALVMPAIASLPNLATLSARGLRMTPAAAVSLATSTAIRRLSLCDCDVGDCVISTLVLRMEQLAKLFVNHNQKKQRPRQLITDAVLPVLVFRPELKWSIGGLCYMTEQVEDLFLGEGN